MNPSLMSKSPSKAAPQTSLSNAAAFAPSQQSSHQGTPSSSVPSTPTSKQALQDVLTSSSSLPESRIPRPHSDHKSNRQSQEDVSKLGPSTPTTPSTPSSPNKAFGGYAGESTLTTSSSNKTSASQEIMEHPVREIDSVVRSLCTGTPKEQENAVLSNFLPDASFIHPFCRVPSFTGINFPMYGEVNSRLLILAVFKWYKILSPRIDIEIESHSFDQRAGLLYLTIRQTFALWFVPAYRAPVRLVTVLHLRPCTIGESGGVILPSDASTSGSSNKNRNGVNASSGEGHGSGRTKYMIACQEDLYQVNEFLQFLGPGILSPLWSLWQRFSTIMCLLGVIFLGPLMALAQQVGIAPPPPQKT